MRFRDVEHQDRALSILRRALRSGRTHHAYLFDGPEGVGKELAARALAARLLCEDESQPADADACGACRACRLMAAGTHPDFQVVERSLHKLHPDRTIRAGKGLFIVVDVLRRFLIEPSSAAPALGRRRIFLVREAERMNEDAQNALLKTLEEPPGRCCLILVSSVASRLLPTIRSRCQRVPFGTLPPQFVRSRLLGAGADESTAAALAGLSGGRLGVALAWREWGLLRLAEQAADLLAPTATPDLERFGKSLIALAASLYENTRSPAARQDQANDADSDGDAESDDDSPASRDEKSVPTDELRAALKLLLMSLAAVQRDGLLCALGAESLRVLPPSLAMVRRLAQERTAAQLDEGIRAVATAEMMLDRNVAPQLALERLAAVLCGAA